MRLILFFIFLVMGFDVVANGTSCPAVAPTFVSKDCMLSTSHGPTPDIVFANYLAVSAPSYSVHSCDFLSSPSFTKDNYNCYKVSSTGYVGAGATFVACTKTFSCPSTYTLNLLSGQCISTSETICGPQDPIVCFDQHIDLPNPAPGVNPHCDYHLEVTPPETCPATTVGNNCVVYNCPDNTQAFGPMDSTSAAVCPPPTTCPAGQHHPVGSSYQCEADEPVVCIDISNVLLNPYPGTADTCSYKITVTPPNSCPSQPVLDSGNYCVIHTCTGPNHYQKFGFSTESCAEPPINCPVVNPGTHNEGDYTCVPDPVTPPGGGGTGDGTGDGGSGGGTGDGGSGSGGGTGDGGAGSGGTGDGTGSGTCGSVACESTQLGIFGKLGEVLGAINTTRSIELAGILETAKKSDAKSAIIAALGQQAVDYVFDLVSKEAVQIAQNTDLMGKIGDLITETKAVQGKQDAFSDKFAQKIDDLKRAVDDIPAKQVETNQKLDDMIEKSRVSLEKQTSANDKLGEIKDKFDEKLDPINGKLDKLSWLEKLGRLDLIADVLDLLGNIWDWFSTVPENIAKLPDKLEQLPQKIREKLDFCADHPDWLFCPVPELPEIDPQDLDTRDIDVDVSPMMSAAGSCPADRVVTLHSGQQLRFSFDYICQLASALRYLVLALSYLAAARILIGAASGGA